MSRKIFVIALALTFVALVAGSAVPPVNAGSKGVAVVITDGPVASPSFWPITMFNGESDTVRFLNQTGVQINVNNTAWPAGATDKDGAGVTVENGEGYTYTFTCPADDGEPYWVFTVTQAALTTDVTVPITCEDVPVPTMTFWGILILVLLIGGTGIWILTRKRLAARQA